MCVCQWVHWIQMKSSCISIDRQRVSHFQLTLWLNWQMKPSFPFEKNFWFHQVVVFHIITHAWLCLCLRNLYALLTVVCVWYNLQFEYIFDCAMWGEKRRRRSKSRRRQHKWRHSSSLCFCQLQINYSKHCPIDATLLVVVVSLIIWKKNVPLTHKHCSIILHKFRKISVSHFVVRHNSLHLPLDQWIVMILYVQDNSWKKTKKCLLLS